MKSQFSHVSQTTPRLPNASTRSKEIRNLLESKQNIPIPSMVSLQQSMAHATRPSFHAVSPHVSPCLACSEASARARRLCQTLRSPRLSAVRTFASPVLLSCCPAVCVAPVQCKRHTIRIHLKKINETYIHCVIIILYI